MVKDILLNFVIGFWNVLAQMAPWLLLGFLCAGLLSVYVKKDWVRRWLGKRGLMQTIKATLVGVPLPLCSCGVIPVAAQLRKQGASRGATIAFLTSTPQTGVDSIAATWGLLGPLFTVVRLIVATLSGIISGVLAGLLPDVKPHPTTETDKLDAGDAALPPKRSLGDALQYGFVTLMRDIGRPLLIGLILAALIGAFVPANYFSQTFESPWLLYLMMTALAIPMYVCATGSLPFAFALLQAGVTPGAALVFLIAGPATNVATISTMSHLLGRATMAVYLAVLLTVSWISGWLFDYFALGHLEVAEMTAHAMQVGWFKHICGAALFALLAYALWPYGKKLATQEDCCAKTEETCCCHSDKATSHG